MNNFKCEDNKEFISNLLDKIFSQTKSLSINATRPTSLVVQFHKLIQQNIEDENSIDYILRSLSSQISSTENTIEAKKMLMNFLPEFFVPFANSITLTFKYISRILTIIQSNVSSMNSVFIANIYSSVIVFVFQVDDEFIEENKVNYEMFLGFCVYNMKQSEEKNQECGVMCLSELMENINYYIKSEKHLKYLWEKLVVFIENENFVYKSHLLKCVATLIVKCGGNKFKDFANITLYKILDFIGGNDNDSRIQALYIVELLAKKCKNEIYSLKKQLIDCLEVLSTDLDQDVKSKANEILKIIFEKEERKDTEKKDNTFIRDQNDSIFKREKNKNFFENAKHSEEVFIVNYSQECKDNNDNISTNDLNIIIKQMKELSDKQISLVDSLAKLQSEFTKTTTQLSNRISKLEDILTYKLDIDLNEEIELSEVEKIIKDKNTKDLFAYYTKIPLKELNEINSHILESSMKLLLSEDNKSINELIIVLKKIIIGSKKKFSLKTRTMLNEKLNQIAKCEDVSEEMQIEIKLILTYLTQEN